MVLLALGSFVFFFFFSSRRRHTRCSRDWSSDVCSSDLATSPRSPRRSRSSSRRSSTSISTASGSSATLRVTCSTTARARAPRIRLPSGAISSSYSSSSSSSSSSTSSRSLPGSSLIARLLGGVARARFGGRLVGSCGRLRLGLRGRGLRRLGLLRLLRRCLRVIEPAASELRVDATTLLGLELRPDTRDRQQLLHLLGRLRAFPQPREGLLAVDVGDRRVLAGPVVPAGLDVAAVAGRARIGDDHPGRRMLLLAHPHEAGLHGHGEGILSRSGPGV